MSTVSINPPDRGIQPQDAALISDAVIRAAIDSIDLTIRKAVLPSGAPRLLNKLQRMGVAVKQEKIRAANSIWGTRILLSRCSTRDALDDIEKTREQLGASITRADIALAVTGMAADEADKLIGRNIGQSYTSRIGVTDIEGTRYTGERTSNRNLVIYKDRAKQWVTGSDEPVLWIELRLNSNTLRRMEIETIDDLRAVDVRQLFARTVKWKRSPIELNRLLDALPDAYAKKRTEAFYRRYSLIGDSQLRKQDFIERIPAYPFKRDRFFVMESMKGMSK